MFILIWYYFLLLFLQLCKSELFLVPLFISPLLIPESGIQASAADNNVVVWLGTLCCASWQHEPNLAPVLSLTILIRGAEVSTGACKLVKTRT